MIESVTDSDWAGCKRSRKSKSSLQIFVGGSLVTSAVRTQKSISLSSGEAEFVAMVSGACEARYVKDCLEYMVKGNYNVEARLRGDSAAGRGIAQRVGCGRVRHLDAGLLWLQQAVKERMFKVGAIAGAANPSDLGTKPVPAARLRELLFKLGAVDESYELVGKAEHEEAAARRNAKELFKNSGTGIKNIKQIMPTLLILSQIQGIEGLSLVAGFENYTLEDVAVIFVTASIGLLLGLLLIGVPGGILLLGKWVLGLASKESARKPCTRDVGTQANLGMDRAEQRFVDEYVNRTTEQRTVIYEQAREIERFEEALREARRTQRNVEVREVVPARIAVATSRGERYHRPGCGNLRSSTVKTYTPCGHCFPNVG